MSAALRGNFSTSSSSTRMLLHARKLSLSLSLCVGNAVKNRRLRQSDPPLLLPSLIVLPDTPVIFSNVAVSARGLPFSLVRESFVKRMEGEEGFFENGSMNYTKGVERFGFDSMEGEEVLIRFLRGNLISGPLACVKTKFRVKWRGKEKKKKRK